MAQQAGFLEAVNSSEPVDLFLILGHKPVRSDMGGTFGIVHDAIGSTHPLIAIQIFRSGPFRMLLLAYLSADSPQGQQQLERHHPLLTGGA